MLARHLQPLDVLLRRHGVGRLGEDEDLALDVRLELGEPLVDGTVVAQHLDVFERVRVAAAGLEGRRHEGDHLERVSLERLEVVPMRLEQVRDRDLGRCGGVLDDITWTCRREALLDEAAEDVVDALAGEAGLACDLRGGVGVAPDEGEIRLGLVGGQAETRQVRDHLRTVCHRQSLTIRACASPA